jgi:hypothetical protein
MWRAGGHRGDDISIQVVQRYGHRRGVVTGHRGNDRANRAAVGVFRVELAADCYGKVRKRRRQHDFIVRGLHLRLDGFGRGFSGWNRIH